MLPAYIIEEILQWEREKKPLFQEEWVQYPLFDDTSELWDQDGWQKQVEDEGITIVDFTI